MATLKDLETYEGKKDLSKKAKENIVQVFCKLESDTKLEDIVAKLLVFPQDVMGNYITQAIGLQSIKEKDNFVDCLIKKIEPIKFGHLFRAFQAFAVLHDYDHAFMLLFSKTETDLIKKNVNKQIFQGLDKTIKDCGFEAFLVKFDEKDKRHLNIFASFLLKYFDYRNSGELRSNIIKFYDLNCLALPKGLLVADAMPDVTEKKPASKKKLAFEEILAMAEEQYKEICTAKTEREEQVKAVEAELKKREVEIQEKNGEISKLRNTMGMLESQGISFKEKIQKNGAEIDRLQREKVALEKANAELQVRLENIASGYGAAGQQEISNLKGKLSARLKGEFAKFAEIKEKQPDMDYYEILLLILDEIQKTLRKNGVEI